MGEKRYICAEEFQIIDIGYSTLKEVEHNSPFLECGLCSEFFPRRRAWKRAGGQGSPSQWRKLTNSNSAR